jgi:hypothetical protein
MNYADTVSIDLKLTVNGNTYIGIAVADKFPDSEPIIIERIYNNIIDEELYLIIGIEEMTSIIYDGGEKFELEYEKQNLKY